MIPLRSSSAALAALTLLVAALPAAADHHEGGHAGATHEAQGGVAPNTLSDSEKEAGWRLLFDGESLDQFRGYNAADVPEGWAVDDGVITFTPGPKVEIKKGKNKGKMRAERRGDLLTRERFDEYELSLEYRISEGGNSGLMFHVVEQEGKPPWHSGPEIQIQDNAGGHDPQKAGWLYQLYTAPTQVPIIGENLPGQTGEHLDATRPVGEWNQLTLKLGPNQGEVNVNGIRYYTFRVGSDDWNKKVAASKFSAFDEFAAADEGHILLQDHGNEVAFRNIKIRDLSEGVQDPVTETISGVRPELAFPNLTWEGWEPYTERGKQVEFIPVLITNAGDGSNRLFVVDQKGVIYAFDERADVTESVRFLDINDKVAHRGKLGDEEGLLGLAFHPQFGDNGRLFVYYTLKDPAHTTVISELTATKGAGDDFFASVDLASERELMRIPQPFPNHNGGTLCFDGEGFLCIALGDGGAFYDPYNNAQDLSTPFGSVLRIDVDRQSDGKPYGIPESNPFADGTGPDGKPAMPETFAYGFRNPWRLMLDEPTGTLWLADVGQNLYEEIDLVVAGGNYGWNYREGLHPFGFRVPPEDADFVDPIWEYDHEVGKSITGGTVYRGTSAPALDGKYVYADYITGKLFALAFDLDAAPGGNATGAVVTGNAKIPSDNMPVVTFGVGESGELYFGRASGNGKGVYKFVQD